MEDIVALKVQDADGKWFAYLTWGRIIDPVEYDWLENAVRRKLKDITAVEVCDSLRDVAHTKYFYEALFDFANEGIPFGIDTYEPWRAAKQRDIEAGFPKLYLLGEC